MLVSAGFLTRVAETQWGLMLCIFAAAHVPALMWIDIPGYTGKDAAAIKRQQERAAAASES